MLSEKKKITFRVFALIYLTAFGVLAWLVFFNEGLDIVQVTADGKTEVFVKNTTMREIANVSVTALSQEKNTVLVAIEKLKPQESKRVETEKILENESVLLVASAPFYQKVEKTFFPASAFGGLDLRIEAPTIVFAGTETDFTVNICNKSTGPQDITISAEFEEGFFSKGFEEKKLFLPPSECISHPFKAIPKQAGFTTIYFNIEANDYTEKIEKTVQVQ